MVMCIGDDMSDDEMAKASVLYRLNNKGCKKATTKCLRRRPRALERFALERP